MRAIDVIIMDIRKEAARLNPKQLAAIKFTKKFPKGEVPPEVKVKPKVVPKTKTKTKTEVDSTMTIPKEELKRTQDATNRLRESSAKAPGYRDSQLSDVTRSRGGMANTETAKTILKDNQTISKAPGSRDSQLSEVTRSRGETPVKEVVKPKVEAEVAKQPVNWTEKMKDWYAADPFKTVALTGGGLLVANKALDNVFSKDGALDIKLNKYASLFIGK